MWDHLRREWDIKSYPMKELQIQNAGRVLPAY